MRKLELIWPGKEDWEQPEPRLLIEKDRYGSELASPRSADNLLIHGENLLGLKALEKKYAGAVKCIYIDPPYNTQSSFAHYDDGMEHSAWLNMMKERLIILRKLLKNDGFICCHIDDSESHYLKILMDEIFGRQNYFTTLYLRVRYDTKHLKQDMATHKIIEQVIIYKKSQESKPYLKKQPDGHDKFRFYVKELSKADVTTEMGNKKIEIFTPGQFEIIESEPSESGLKEIWASGTILDGNSSGRFFRDFLGFVA